MQLTFSTHSEKLKILEKQFNATPKSDSAHKCILLCCIEQELEQCLAEIKKRTDSIKEQAIRELSIAAFGM